jgi:hypothetical protein
MSNIGATSTPRAIGGLCLAAAITVLAGCGSGTTTGPDSVLTLTTTPTVTAKAPPKTTTATTPSNTVRSDEVGRKFDLGSITGVENEGGVPVIIFDRWTAEGVSDSTLAANGVPIHVHSDAPYQNRNTRTTYRVPVAGGAVFTYRHCVALDQPPVLRSSNLDEFARLDGPEKVVLLSIDPSGQAVKAENDPAC